MIDVTHFSDPGCPWAYSSSPYLAVLQWRYGDQLRWRHVMIGLTEDKAQYDARGYRPVSGAIGFLRRFRPLGMPFDTAPRSRNMATGLACRAVVATRLLDPAREVHAFRALQFGRFTDSVVFDEPDGVRAALARVDGLDVDAVVGALDDEGTESAYQEDRALARTAAGSPTEFQGRSAQTDGPVRYTAPSLILRHDGGATLEAGGFQHLDAYDVLIANLDPTLERRPPAETAAEVLRAFPYPLATREVAAVMAPHLTEPDDEAAEESLIVAVGEGAARRQTVGGGALWHAAG